MLVDILLKLKNHKHLKETVCEDYDCLHEWTINIIPEMTKGIARLTTHGGYNFRTILFQSYPHMMVNLFDILNEDEFHKNGDKLDFILEITELNDKEFNDIIKMI